ncbi:Pumilio RNA-binding repeat [Macleaya cordata]|uniref:Pumilio RNA-binding repeat n=1 Tax=Macleaya cordata TaxID=56857 RepID=A0A200PM85_MACCD|nr:Pumilio RNA-binding repeat [Macleaya cordata]
MKDNEEFDMLLNEIPHATSVNHQHLIQQQQQQKTHNPHQNHHHGHVHVHDGHGFSPKHTIGMYYDNTSYHQNCNSPVSGLSLQSGDSSAASSLSGRSTPLEETKSQTPQRNTQFPNGFVLESNLPDSSVDFFDDSVDEVNLSRNLFNMNIRDGQDNFSNISGYPYGNVQFSDLSSVRTNNGYVENNGFLEDYRRCSSDIGGFGNPFTPNLMNLNQESMSALLGLQERCQIGNLSGSPYISPVPSDSLLPYLGSSVGTPWLQKMEHSINDESLRNLQFQEAAAAFVGDYNHIEEIQVHNTFPAATRPFVSNGFLYPMENGRTAHVYRGALDTPSSPHLTNPRRVGTTPNSWNPHSLSSVKSARNVETFSCEGSWILQGSSLNNVNNKRSDLSREHRKVLDGLSHSRRTPSIDCRNSLSPKMYNPFIMPLKYDSLCSFQGNIYSVAKDQNGCRFLQRKFDEGTPQEIEMIFNEIIHHVVELMVNPFGNYLIQKLLDVCTEQQRMQILIMVTSEPGELVRISLNTHGTRVVQKLIDTLKTREQISLVISALEPRFIHLMKDPNGNHVVQRCLQCLSSEDNKFIFDAAAKFCIDIATDRHGCCVLQKCISHSMGGRREKLVAEISIHGLFLAQDAYGNYVIQYIVEQLRIPSANATLHSQFQGNYVHLAMQKFSSNVVQKCLQYFNEENRIKIIHELLLSPQFEQLLQDPFANYVIQTALEVSKGSLHASLAGAIRPHAAALKMIPYFKRIYSKILSKK